MCGVFLFFFFLKQHLQERFQGWQMSAFLDDALQSALRLSKGWMIPPEGGTKHHVWDLPTDGTVASTPPNRKVVVLYQQIFESTCSGDTKKVKVGNFQGMKSQTWLWWGIILPSFPTKGQPVFRSTVVWG